jgi:hypothetical protein
MLTIRSTQIDAMMQEKKLNAASVIAQSLQETVTFFQYYSEPQLQTWVSRQIDYLAQLNIHEKDNVEMIIDIIALHGDQFERCADPSWALSILEDTQTNEGIRAIMLQRANKDYLKQC